MGRTRMSLSLRLEGPVPAPEPTARCQAREGAWRRLPCRAACLLPWRSALAGCLIRDRLGLVDPRLEAGDPPGGPE
jgi:hypothetical protein